MGVVQFKKDTGGTLNNGLLGYWKMNDLLDSVGTNHLAQGGTQNATFYSGGGQGSGYANFIQTSSSVYQALIGSQAYAITLPFTMAGWMKFGDYLSLGATRRPCFHNGKSSPGTSTRDGNGISFISAGSTPNHKVKFQFDRFSASSVTESLADIPETTLNIDLADWIFVANILESNRPEGSSGTRCYMFVGGKPGSSLSNILAASSGSGTVPSSNVEFGGSEIGNATYRSTLGLSMQEWGFWNRGLLNLELTDLWNSGLGQRPMPNPAFFRLVR